MYRHGRFHQVQVLTLTAAGISGIVAFCDRSLFRAFDLPEEAP
jgi:hypothetical protein